MRVLMKEWEDGAIVGNVESRASLGMEGDSRIAGQKWYW
jgi:hypothetical protein